MDYKEIINAIRQKQYKPVYFLHGEEDYFIDAITQVIENEILDESEKAFNQTVVYGKDVDLKDVLDIAKRYPMMSPYQVVVVKEAQDMKTLTQLQAYVEAPLSTTVLLIAHKHKKIDGRSAFAKALSKHAVVFEAKPLYDNQVPDFIKQWLKDHRLQIDEKALYLMVDFLGTDLGKIINELEKLRINLPAKAQISVEMVEQYVGISREYNVFELQKALVHRQIVHAHRIVNYFEQNPKEGPLVMIVGSLFNFFSKLYIYHFIRQMPPLEQVKKMGLRSEWFLKEYVDAAKQYPRQKVEDIIGLLRQYDMKAKGVDTGQATDGALMRELIHKILH